MNTAAPSILLLNVAGQPFDWITYEKAAYYYAKELISWQIGSRDYTLHGGTNRITNEQSTLPINSIIAVKNNTSVHKNTPLTNKTLFKRDRNICAYCGTEHTNSILTRDHIIPTSRGGANNWMNVVTACKPCNSRKDDNLLDHINMKLVYVPYVPNVAEYLILRNRNILADQMDYLSKQVPKGSRIYG